jgi:uncharacterized protein (TIGR03083 family)
MVNMQVPIPTVHLFPKLDEKLIELLKSLRPAEWSHHTVAKKWTVKDVATHLLDGNIRTLSMVRDNFFGDTPDQLDSYEDLVDFLNRLNADWVKASKRMSPAVLIELLEITGKEYTTCIASLDPFQPAVFSVAWAGEERSLNWFHIAREYTEKWHHQQQIREAVSKPGIMTREFYYPLMDTFLQALPHTYRNVYAEQDQAIEIIVTSEIGGSWYLLFGVSGWILTKAKPERIDSCVTIDPETAWKLCTKALSGYEAENRIKFAGNMLLGKPILSILSVMA